FFLAAFISRSTSASVRYSRVRSLLLGGRLGVTVRFTVIGVTSFRCLLAMCFALPALTTVRIIALYRTVCQVEIADNPMGPSCHLEIQSARWAPISKNR